jgi:hypothetical protein
MIGDVIKEKDESKLSCMDRIKLKMYKVLMNHAFIVVTLCASVFILILNRFRFQIHYLIWLG